MASVLINGVTVAEHDPSVPVRADRWAALSGRWKFDGNRASYEGLADPKLKVPAIALSSLRLRDGSVSLNISLSRNQDTTAGVVLGYHSDRSEYVMAQLGAYNHAYAISLYSPDFGWEALAAAGDIKNLVPNQSYAVEVRVGGQKVRFTVDGVNVLETVLRRPLQGAGFGLFAFDDGPIAFRDVVLQTNPLRVFVIMPFREPFDTLYADVIKPEAEDLGFDIVRVDEIPGPGIILEDIRRQIEEAHVVVAEISEPNPNVFYELGYAHALRKPALLLVRREQGKDMPFDVRSYRAIFYDDTIGGKKSVQAALRKHLAAIQRDF